MTGVPAGATHVCRLHDSYWRKRPTVPGAAWLTYIMVGNTECPEECVFQLEPIAEAGPAPTTAAPAEQPEDECAFCHERFGTNSRCLMCQRAPGEQPGKAADPRPVCTARFTRNGKREVCGQPNCSDPDHRTQIAEDLRPAQPQAPAEPTQEQIEKATAVVANLWGPKSLHVALVGKIAAALAAEAAPLREECDRLARESGEARFCGLQNEQRLRRERDAGRAKAAERDARIATLEKALGSAASALDDAAKALAAKWQHPGLCSGQDAEELSKTGFWAGIGEVMAHTMRAARRARRAALGASE